MGEADASQSKTECCCLIRIFPRKAHGGGVLCLTGFDVLAISHGQIWCPHHIFTAELPQTTHLSAKFIIKFRNCHSGKFMWIRWEFFFFKNKRKLKRCHMWDVALVYRERETHLSGGAPSSLGPWALLFCCNTSARDPYRTTEWVLTSETFPGHRAVAGHTEQLHFSVTELFLNDAVETGLSKSSRLIFFQYPTVFLLIDIFILCYFWRYYCVDENSLFSKTSHIHWDEDVSWMPAYCTLDCGEFTHVHCTEAAARQPRELSKLEGPPSDIWH